MKRVLTVVAAAGLLWGVGLTSAAAATEKEPLTCEQAQARVDENRAAHDELTRDAQARDAEAQDAEEAAADARNARDAARSAAADARSERDEAREAAAEARQERDDARAEVARLIKKRDDHRASAADARAKRDEIRNTDGLDEIEGKDDADWDHLATTRQRDADLADAAIPGNQQRADEADAEATRQQNVADEADAQATAKQNEADAADAEAARQADEAKAARQAAKEARADRAQLDEELPGLIDERDEACPGIEPGAIIKDANCEVGGVNVLLDNSKGDEKATFTIATSFGDKSQSKTVEVPAGKKVTAVAPAPTGVEGTVTVTANDQVLAEETGTLTCGDGKPGDQDDKGDDKKAAAGDVEQKGESLPFTGSSTGLIALIAAGLLAAGGATLGGLKLVRSRG